VIVVSREKKGNETPKFSRATERVLTKRKERNQVYYKKEMGKGFLPILGGIKFPEY